MKTLNIISKKTQSLLKTNFKRIFSIIQNKRVTTVKTKGGLYSSESNSLLFQMYLHEDEDLFI
ncbi:hypothetical protein QWY99_01370 [Flavobacterium branchiarum]|uniref:Uncharacterized protein n=1 Tax=Flavobacterium branchiarum TaxID=1114870 RepID=A0ABV5FQS9_9FLAO|nr:hypothetical protein [Flavobacterium branchiarum]MDN3671716.1 hypothetical protein [Flavobacterium branchiarum]